MSARDELIEYVLTSPSPTRPSLSGLLAGVEREAREKAQTITIAAVAKPGDTLLVGFDHQMSDAEFQVMRDRLRPLKDRLGIEIVLIEGASSMIVVRRELDVNGAPIRLSETVLGAFKGSVCPYTQSHTREFCGYDACRER